MVYLTLQRLCCGEQMIQGPRVEAGRLTGWDSIAVAQVRDDGVLNWVVQVEVRSYWISKMFNKIC